MKPLTILTAILLAFSSTAFSQDAIKEINNPLQDAREGDTVEYSIESVLLDSPVGKNEKHTNTSSLSVVEIDRQLVKLEVKSDIREGSQTISLTSRGTMVDLLTGAYQDVNISSSSVTEETVEFEGKSYVCKVIHLKFTAKTKHMGMTVPVKVDQKVWYSNEIPVHGQVKSVVDMEMTILGDKKTHFQTTTTLNSFTEG